MSLLQVVAVVAVVAVLAWLFAAPVAIAVWLFLHNRADARAAEALRVEAEAAEKAQAVEAAHFVLWELAAREP